MANEQLPKEDNRRPSPASDIQAFNEKYKALFPGRPVDFAMPLPLSL